MPVLGGTGDVREPDDNVHQITRDIKEDLENKTGLQFDEFVAVKYKSQLVNGTNYFIKIRSGENQHLHVRVHKTFQGHLTLSAYQLDKHLTDELEYFQ